MQIPVIDFARYDETKPSTIKALAEQVSAALTEIGFMAVTNIGVMPEQLQQVFETSEQFFHSSQELKKRCAYRSAQENFGFQGLLEEHLDPGLPADLKETFTMRDPVDVGIEDPRWPSADFRDMCITFYRDTVGCAEKVLRVFAAALDVEADFFVNSFSGENVSLRFLHYPSVGPEAQSDQLGAGAHTDYGIITLLFQDDVGGLEVQDAEGEWHAVDYVENAIIINTGDLMERWTNGLYKSTRHRVQPKIGQRERYSIALFMDPDSATQVEVLASCISDDLPAKYPRITAGEHIQSKLEASHGY